MQVSFDAVKGFLYKILSSTMLLSFHAVGPQLLIYCIKPFSQYNVFLLDESDILRIHCTEL